MAKKPLEYLVDGVKILGTPIAFWFMANAADAQIVQNMEAKSIPSQTPVTGKFYATRVSDNTEFSTMLDSTTGKGSIYLPEADIYKRQLEVLNHYRMKDSGQVNSNEDLQWNPIKFRQPTSPKYTSNLEEIKTLTESRPTDNNHLIKRFPDGKNIKVYLENIPSDNVSTFDTLKSKLYNKTNGNIKLNIANADVDTGWTIKYVHSDQMPQPVDGWTERTPGTDGSLMHSTSWINIDIPSSQKVLFREAGRALGFSNNSIDQNMIMYYGNPTTQEFADDEYDVFSTVYNTPNLTNMNIYIDEVVKNYTDVKLENRAPVTFGISQNYPNPFNPETKIQYEIKERSKVKIDVYNIKGQRVKTLVDDKREAGVYEIDFNGKNLASGNYFYKITTSNSKGFETSTKKMTLIK